MPSDFMRAAFVSASVLAVNILVSTPDPTLFEGWTLLALVSIAPLALMMWLATHAAAHRSEATARGHR